MSDMTHSARAQILVVDDEPVVRNLLARWLQDDGYACVTADGPVSAWDQLHAQSMDLVTLDITMPGGSGLDVLDQIQTRLPDTAVLMLTAQGDTGSAIRALTAGACGYLLKPVDSKELLLQVERGLQRRRLIIENRDYTHRLEDKVREQTGALRRAHEETIYRLVRASAYRDEETGAHIERTGWYSEILAAAIGWRTDQVDVIRLAAPMHDIGKIAIPDAVLRKPGTLSPDELAVMRTHTRLGATMLAGSESQVLQMAQDIALCHHEHWDGTGYPSGLRRTEIPAAARIVAIVDVFDALTHDRVYRPALSEADALSIMHKGRGAHFDPAFFDAFLSVLPEIRAIAQSFEDDRDERAVPLSAREPLLPCAHLLAETDCMANKETV